MIRLSQIILIISFISCSNINYKVENSADSKADISFEENINHNEKVNIKIEKEFFLWGFYPNHEIKVDDVVAKNGYDSISELVIKEEPSKMNVLFTLLTFGVYYPQTYYLEGKIRN